MAITLVGSVSTGFNGGGSSTSVNVPAGVANGDLLIAQINGYKSGGVGVSVPNTPAGWTLIGEAQTSGGGGAGNVALGVYYRVAASEPASYSLSNNGAGDTYVDAAIMALRGVDTVSPFNLTSVSAAVMGSSPAGPNPGTTTRDGVWYILCASSYDGITGSPGGFTSDANWDGTPPSQYIGHKVISPAGATGAQSFGTNFTDGTVIWALTIQPPGVASGGGRREIHPGPAFRRRFYRAVRHPRTATAAVAGPVTTPITLAVTTTSAVALPKAVSKPLAVSLATSVALPKQIGKPLALTTSTAAGLLKQVGKPLALTTTTGAGLLKLTGKALAVTTSGAPTLLKLVAKALAVSTTTTTALLQVRLKLVVLAVTTTTAPALLKLVGKALTASSPTTASLSKLVGKVLARSTTSTVSLVAIKARFVTLAVTTTTTVAMVRQVGKSLAVSLASSPVMTRAVARTLALTTTTIAALAANRTKLQPLAVTTTTAVSMARQVGKSLAVTTTTAPGIRRVIGKVLAASSATTAAMARRIGKGLAVSTVTQAFLDAVSFVGAPTAPLGPPVVARLLQAGRATLGLIAGRSRAQPQEGRDDAKPQ